MDARRYAPLAETFTMQRGGQLRGARIAYETLGALNAARDNAILIFTGLSPPAHVASSPEDDTPGWWQEMVGPGLSIDTRRYFVVTVNSLGSCFGSTGPASLDPATGERYRLRFPELAVEDIARGGHAVLAHLGIARADTVLGPSLGGMVALAFAALFPGAARRLVCVSGTQGASPFTIALRSLQREAILRDPEWREGQYAPDLPPRTGLRLARKLGTITYRSAGEWLTRFGRERIAGPNARADGFGPEFAIEGYLEAQAEKFVRAFDANCYLYLSRAMDRFELSAHGGSNEAALARCGIERALVIGVESDILFPIAEQRAIVATLERVGVPTNFAPLPSIEGHDAFLVDIPRFGATIGGFLEQGGSA